MQVDPGLTDRIYEAAAMPQQWPAVLEAIAREIDAFGICFVHRTPDHAGFALSERMQDFAAAYLAEGWLERDDRVPPVLAEHYPGFRIDADYWTEQQVQEIPIYREFLLPRGMQASAACALQGAKDDALHVGVEGLASYASARLAVPFLDALRPDLARAISLSAKLSQARLEASVASLELAGVGAAIVSQDHRIRAVNDRFSQRFAGRMIGRFGRAGFADRFLQEQVTSAITASKFGPGVQSVAVAATEDRPACAIHVVPLRGGARDVFEWDGVLLLLAEPGNASVPNADLLRLLFDLTPAEARLTRRLLEGGTLIEAARLCGVAEATARTQLKAVFAKTGATRQADLLRLLNGMGPPSR